MKIARGGLSFPDAWCLKSAELWLRLGQPVQAVLELQKLTRRAARHPLTAKVIATAIRSVSPR